MCAAASPSPGTSSLLRSKGYDYSLKFLLVGDSDVGKEEILGTMGDNGSEAAIYGSDNGVDYRTTTILLDGKRVKLQVWDTSGQGRFCTIFRSYSRGAQGVLVVYDITNKWSFDSIDRWLKEVDEHAPGVPKILVGNRLHLAFKRQVSEEAAWLFAVKNGMSFYEISPLCDYNVSESLATLSRLALQRNGSSRCWGVKEVLSLQELCCRTIVTHVSSKYGVDSLPLPTALKSHLKSYRPESYTPWQPRTSNSHRDKHRKKILNVTDSPPTNCRKSCVIS